MTYPDFPDSRIEFEVKVTAPRRKEWSTHIGISGSYTGPTDVVGVKDYQLRWTSDGARILEEGSATLDLASGGKVRSVWTSSIVPDQPRLARFPKPGEAVKVTYSPFRIEGNTLSYEWQGAVEVSPGAAAAPSGG